MKTAAGSYYNEPAAVFSLSKNYPNGSVSGIIEETGVFSWKTGEKTHGES